MLRLWSTQPRLGRVVLMRVVLMRGVLMKLGQAQMLEENRASLEASVCR